MKKSVVDSGGGGGGGADEVVRLGRMTLGRVGAEIPESFENFSATSVSACRACCRNTKELHTRFSPTHEQIRSFTIFVIHFL